jgi:electron transfer flavoprotein alpha/beta subunit
MIMGIVIGDELDVAYGITMSNCYACVDTMTITKGEESGKYVISARCPCFISEEQRLNQFRRYDFSINTDTLDNIWEQVYTELKKNFENYTDCI